MDTRSNAEETARWVAEHRFRSIRLVTSDWHMARARMELGAALGGDVRIVRDGVPGEQRLGPLVNEYNKLAAAPGRAVDGRRPVTLRSVIDWLRTALFRILFYAASVPIVLLVPVSALFGRGR